MNGIKEITKQLVIEIESDTPGGMTKSKAALKRVLPHISIEEMAYILNTRVYYGGVRTGEGTLITHILTDLKYQALGTLIIKTIGDKGFKSLLKAYRIGAGSKRLSNIITIKRVWKDLRLSESGTNKGKAYRELWSASFTKKVDRLDKDIDTLSNTLKVVLSRLPGVSYETGRGNQKMIVVDRPEGLEPASPNVSAVPFDVYENELELDIRETIAEQALRLAANQQFAIDLDLMNAVDVLIADRVDLFNNLVDAHPESEEALIEKTKDIKDAIIQMKSELLKINDNKFYSRYKLDFRGRLYMLSPLSTLGCDCRRSLVRFGEKKSIGENGKRDLLLSFGGAIGADKDSFGVRHQVGLDNMDKGIEVGKALLSDPVKGFEMVTEMFPKGKPFNVASHCVELARLDAFDGPDQEFKSDLLLQMDCTCSGIQLQAILTGNDKLAAKVNVVKDTDEDTGAEDLYMALADAVTSRFEGSSDEMEQVYVGLDSKTKRGMLKPCVMRDSYGACYLNLRDAVAGKALHLFDGDKTRANEFGAVVVKAFNQIVAEDPTFKSLGEFKALAKDFAKSFGPDEHPHFEIPIDLGYRKQTIRSTYIEVPGTSHYLVAEGKTQKLTTYSAGELLGRENHKRNKKDVHKSRNAMPPNLIHSLDAMLLHKITVDMEGEVGLTHDCYACRPGALDKLRLVFKKTLVDMFTGSNAGMLNKLTGSDLPLVDDTWVEKIMNGTHGIC